MKKDIARREWMAVSRLEYRLLEESQGYPVLYYYENLDSGEIAARFACDKFIKGGVVYEKTSCAIEVMCYVVYIQESGRAQNPAGKEGAFPVDARVRIEVRQDGESPSPGLIIGNFVFDDSIDVVLHLLCDYLYWLGTEWLRTMTVLDEDRKVYICYAKQSR
jgi:hypothetical protein